MTIGGIFYTLFLFLFISSYQVLSIYEDEVGIMEWHHKYIGKVNEALFHTQRPGRKCVVVSTEENIIASVDLRHGDILWRRVLGNHDTIDRIGIILAKYVITLSSMGGILRAWNILDGQLVWETFLDGSIPSKPLLSLPVNLRNYRGSTIIVYSRGYLHAISGIDGGLIWKNALGDDRADPHHIINSIGDDIYLVGLAGTSRLVSQYIDAHNGDSLSEGSAIFSGGFSLEVSIIVYDVFVALNMGKSSFISAKFKDREIHFHETEIAILVGSFSGVPMLSPSKMAGMFFLKTDAFTAIITVTKGGNNLELVRKIRHPVVLSDAISLPDGREFIALIRQNGVKVDLMVKTLLDWDVSSLVESVELDADRGLVHTVFGNNYVRTDRSHGFRVLVVMEDHSLLLVQQGEIVWRREDGLATIVYVTTCEVPVGVDGRDSRSIVKVEKSLLEWLQFHMVKMKGMLTPTGLINIQKAQGLGKVKAGRTWSGKLLVVLTKSGKLFGLRAIDGHIVWSVLSPSLRKSEACNDPSGISLHQLRVPHRLTAVSSPSVLVHGRCRLGPSGPFTILSSMDAYTGIESTHLNLPYLVVQVIPLPNTDSSESRLYLLIDGSGIANLYPRSSEAKEIFISKSPDVYWHSVYPEHNTVRGYVVKKTDCFGDGFSFFSRELWSVIFQPESENIIGAFIRDPKEVVHTQAKVTMNEDVFYKHVSKNIVFIVLGTPPMVDTEDSKIVAYIIDTITGRIIHSVTHAASRGPVHAVFSDNWIIYHYFNVRAHRNEMSVIEIYDQSRAENKDVWKLITGDHNLTSAISSFSWPEITTKSQSYFFTHSVKTMAVTLTAKGITSKQLLVGTIGDQVLALDKRLLDPDQSERDGISHLTEFLPIKPEWYVTHRYKVEGLAGIVTFPAKLESTSFVFAYGFDLFLACVAPSKMYDSLTQDFSYALLLFTILSLVAAIFVTWILSQRNELQEKWR